MKRTSAFIRAAALSLAVMLTASGCTSSPVSPSEMELTDDISAAETSTEAAPAAVPVDKAFEGIDSYTSLYLGYTSDGKYELVDQDEYGNMLFARYMSSEEFYNAIMEEYALYADDEEASEYYSEYKDMTYEEFKEKVYSEMETDPAKYDKYSMFVEVSYSGEEGYADHSAAAKRGFDFFNEKFSADSGFTSHIHEKNNTVYVSIHQRGDIISVSAAYDDKDGEPAYIFEDELLCIFGENYFLIGTAAVPKDIKSLYISNSDEKTATWISDYSKEEYDAAVFEYYGSHSNDYSERTPFDLTDIAEQLPELEKLYISAAIPVSGIEGLAKYDNFSALDISVWNLSEESSLKAVSALSNTEQLRVRDIESKDETELLKGVKAKTLAVECSCGRDDDLLKNIYTVPNVTEFKMSAGFSHETADLNGIAEMKSLKKLYIGGFDTVDFAPLSGLGALEELTITGNNGMNYGSIGKIKTLRSLKIYGAYDENGDDDVDLSVLSNCTSVEYLDVYHVDKSLYSAFKYMTNLKKLKFGVGSGFYSGLGEAANAVSAEEIIIENNDTVNLKGVSKLTNLKSLTLTNCGFENISELNGCPDLKTLIIDCEKQHTFDAENIENNTKIEELYLKNVGFMHYRSLKTLTGLKKLTLDSTNLTEEQIDDLRKDMTWCEFEAVQPEKETDADGENDGENTETEEADKSSSFAEPLETVYIDDIRVETYEINGDYWDKNLNIKNCGENPLESLPEFLKENGFTEGRSELYITYPERDGEAYSEVTEIIRIIDNDFDYDNNEVYLSVLSVLDEDYIDNCRYRTLQPGCTAEVLVPIKGKSRDEY